MCESPGISAHVKDVGSMDPPQVALLLLCQCGSFCKMVLLSRSTPPSVVAGALQMYDNASSCLAVVPLAMPGSRPNFLLPEIGWVYIAFHKTLSTAYISSVSASVSVHASLE